MKTFLKDAAIVSIFDFQKDEKKLLGRIIFGIVIKDETKRYLPEFRVITSTIKSQKNFEFITKSGNCYVINDAPGQLDITFVEFVVMRHRLSSPSEILEMRQTLKLTDDRTIH
ncbi:MAG: hypothetical protein JKX78_07705 [Alteromonadaceae bacterium]|nr:hypothetical protein [Alteromonadaceae bacterium]